MGCGSGEHSLQQFLAGQRYRVHFVDVSSRVIERLKARLVARGITEDCYLLQRIEIERLADDHASHGGLYRVPYEVVFCDGVMFHLGSSRVPEVLRWFHCVLAPGGVLFVNFKIDDHTMVSLDGRFFEYYETTGSIERMLLGAGFDIEDVTLTSKDSSMYGFPYPTRWAHYICSKARVAA